MNNEKARALHQEIEDALKAIGKKHGLQIWTGSLRYDGTGFRMSMDGKTVDEAAGGITVIAVQKALLRGLDPNLANAKGWKLVDYNPRAHRTPWIIQAPNNKRYRIDDMTAINTFSPRIVKPLHAALGMTPTSAAHEYASVF